MYKDISPKKCLWYNTQDFAKESPPCKLTTIKPAIWQVGRKVGMACAPKQGQIQGGGADPPFFCLLSAPFEENSAGPLPFKIPGSAPTKVGHTTTINYYPSLGFGCLL